MKFLSQSTEELSAILATAEARVNAVYDRAEAASSVEDLEPEERIIFRMLDSYRRAQIESLGESEDLLIAS